MIQVEPFMIVSAVRYALTRSTYIVGMTVDEVIRLWPDIPDRDKIVIERDVSNYWPRTNEIDRAEWQRLIDRIEQ